jgi:hypothetical protein
MVTTLVAANRKQVLNLLVAVAVLVQSVEMAQVVLLAVTEVTAPLLLLRVHLLLTLEAALAVG